MTMTMVDTAMTTMMDMTTTMMMEATTMTMASRRRRLAPTAFASRLVRAR
jgi:hypothetical protein